MTQSGHAGGPSVIQDFRQPVRLFVGTGESELEMQRSMWQTGSDRQLLLGTKQNEVHRGFDVDE